MKTLRLVLGDQLSPSVSALRDIDRARDVVLMVEAREEATYVRHHKQKIVLVLSAMRHFARSLREAGVRVDYVRLDDEGNSGSFTGELRRAISRHAVDRIIVTEPGEWRVWVMMESWEKSSASRWRFVKMIGFFAPERSLLTGRRAAGAFAWSFFTVRCGARRVGS